MRNRQNEIKDLLLRSAAIKTALANDSAMLAALQRAADMLKETASAGGTIYSCGNGGSACDAMHLAEELVARYKRERPGIRAMHLVDPGILTCWSNDYDFDGVFARQIETFGKKGDVLVAISTSGNSKNVLRAVEAAKSLGVSTIALCGKDGGKLAPICDISLVVPVSETERIQESHITFIHILCELLET